MGNDATIAAHNKYAHIYDEEVAGFWNNFPPAFIDRFVDSLPGKRVLDLGSGSGRDAILLRDRGLEVICVDASISMVDITSNLRFESHLMTFAKLDFPEDSFDGVWAYTSLIHIPPAEAGKVIKTINTLLRPRGILMVGAMEGKTAGMVERATMPGAARYFKKYARNELKQVVKAAGFHFITEQDDQPHNSVYLNQIYRKALQPY